MDLLSPLLQVRRCLVAAAWALQLFGTVKAQTIGGPCIQPDWSAAASVTRANLACDGQRWLSQYGARIQHQDEAPSSTIEAKYSAGYQPWWDEPVRSGAAATLGVSVDQLVEGALRYSSYVQVVSAEPWIRQTAIVEEQAAFDWRTFWKPPTPI